MMLEDKGTQLEGVQYATREEWKAITNSSRKNEVARPNGNDAQMWKGLVVKVKSDAVKNNITQESGILGEWSR